MLEIINNFIIMIPLMLGILFFGKMVLNDYSKLSLNKEIILFILICILQAITLTYFEGTVKKLLMLGINGLLYKKEYKISVTKAIFASFIAMIIFTIIDVLEVLIVTNIASLGKIYCYNNYAGTVQANIITTILFVIIIYFSQRKIKKFFNTEIGNNIKIIILSILTLMSILIFFYTFIKSYEFSNDIIKYIIAIIVLATVLLSLIKQTIENNKLTKEYDNLLEFMTTYETEIEKQRVLRHETKNELLTIKAKLCDNENNKEIIDYIDELLNDKTKVKQEEYAKLGYLPPNGIKGLCYFKVQEAETKGIKVALNISKRITKSIIYVLSTKEQKDFGRILGVILDNAIEACFESKKKEIGIEAYSNINNDFKIIISNTYKNNIKKNKIGKEKFSTKGKNRGHGLLLVNHIIKQNNMFKLKTETTKKVYTQILEIKKV